MKRFFYRYRKQIFCFSTIFMIFLTSITTVGAYWYDDAEIPSDQTLFTPFPVFPVATGYSYYLPSGYGFTTVLPAYNLDIVARGRNGSIDPSSTFATCFPFPLTLSQYNRSLNGWTTVQSDAFVYDPLDVGIVNTSSVEMLKNSSSILVPTMYEHLFYFTEYGSLDSPGTDINSLQFRASNFAFAAYCYYTSSQLIPIPLFRLTMYDPSNELHTKNFDYRLKGSFRFLGNYHKHSFDKVATSVDGTLLVNYSDIVTLAFPDYYDKDIIIDARLDRFDHSVPIIFENFVVEIVLPSDTDVTVDRTTKFRLFMPILSEDLADWRTLELAIVNAYEHSPVVEYLSFDWLIMSVSSFFSAPLFGVISLGGIAITGVTVSVALAVIKLLNTLK